MMQRCYTCGRQSSLDQPLLHFDGCEVGKRPMTDDRKRNTGGEVERFAFEIRAMASKKDVVLRLRRADAIVKQVNAALAESRAECERLQEQADWCSDALRIEIGQFVGANATLEALTIRACNDLARYKARAERLTGVLLECRPYIGTALRNKIDTALNLEQTP